MIVYVSSPYSADTIEQIRANVEFAAEVGKQVLLAGHTPLIPHVMSAFWDYDGRLGHLTHTDWMKKYALPLLIVSDAILMAGAWESSIGCQIELGCAKTPLLKPVFYSVDQLKTIKEAIL